VSSAYVPQPRPTPPGREPTPIPPHTSEATRLLCVGTYVDADYRDRVIEELYLNEQRLVAPSLGLDAGRVLAHALRARREETAWAAAIAGLWTAGMLLTGGWLLLLLAPGLLLAAAPVLRGRTEQPPLVRTLPAFLARLCGRCLSVLAPLVLLASAFGATLEQRGADTVAELVSGRDPGALPSPSRAWLTLGTALLIALCLRVERGRRAAMLSAELSPRRFPEAAADPAERALGERYRRVRRRIETEQHSPLIIYDDEQPFRGAGEAYDTWVLPIDLLPAGPGEPQPLSNREILDRIRTWIHTQRVPSPFAGHATLDRQRWLEVDECVFLPAQGLMRRDDAPYDAYAFTHHRDHSVEEGGERRRHFLRVRIGGWEEELVITVYVRVHTHGSMLMLDVAPYVLTPLRTEFRNADRAAHRYRHSTEATRLADAVLRVPGSAVGALAVLFRAASYGWKRLTGPYAWELPSGPALSVRELGSEPKLSPFQELDRDRYVRGVQDRVAQGVSSALSDAGYHTGRFVQQVVNVSNGGVLIGSVEGSTFAIGDHASATRTTDGGEPNESAEAADGPDGPDDRSHQRDSDR
jgi:hypothetical protein